MITTIKETYITVQLGPSNTKYYECLGYSIPRRKTKDGICVQKGSLITVLVIDLPRSSHVKVTKICDLCGKHIPGIPYRDVLKMRSSGIDVCASCRTSRINRQFNAESARERNLLSEFPQIAAEWYYEGNSMLPDDVLPGSHYRAWWKCKDCSHEWQAAVCARVSGTGCPICRKSRGERSIRDSLEKLGVKYLTQVSVPGLLGIRGSPLQFDFVINDFDLVIEYDGEQHFRPVNFASKPEADVLTEFERICEHDRRKNAWCGSNKIPILRIPYYNYAEIPDIVQGAIDKYVTKQEG